MQLDAVTKSVTAISIGFKTSFMESLCKLPLYQQHPKTKMYNPRYITQLVKNYRSHPAILRFPNTMFYKNSLQPHAPAGSYSLK